MIKKCVNVPRHTFKVIVRALSDYLVSRNAVEIQYKDKHTHKTFSVLFYYTILIIRKAHE